MLRVVFEDQTWAYIDYCSTCNGSMKYRNSSKKHISTYIGVVVLGNILYYRPGGDRPPKQFRTYDNQVGL